MDKIPESSYAHTPGPWIDKGNGDVIVFDENGGVKDICSVYATFYDDTDAANACLIAAHAVPKKELK